MRLLQSYMEWPEWETLSHMGLVIAYIYIFYKGLTDKSVRTMQNILLLTIIIALDIIIHQNINRRSGHLPSYWNI